MDIFWFSLTAFIVGIGTGWLIRWKSQKKKMDQMKNAVESWETIQIANQSGIRIKAEVTQVRLINRRTEPGTTKIEIFASRQFAGMYKPLTFKGIYIVDNNSQARFQIPDKGDEVKIIFVSNDPSIYYMERPW